jgi:hypothetical protein
MHLLRAQQVSSGSADFGNDGAGLEQIQSFPSRLLKFVLTCFSFTFRRAELSVSLSRHRKRAVT